MSAASEQTAAARVSPAAAEQPQLLRFATAGSVDDGKSTLIGRLLYDAKSLHADALEAVTKNGEVDLALLTDGLRAEREQGITIDVAYRHFATPKRRFIIADTPGHAQYTRNMVTGASTADLAIVLVDAREGLLTQSRRHAAIAGAARDPADRARRQQDGPRRLRPGRLPAHLRRVPRLGRRAWTSRSSPASRSPRCKGDNVVERSENLAWFGGPTLLQYLEEAPVAAGLADGPLRLPVQWVVRDQETEHRGYAGQLAGGTVRVGDEVVVLPAGTTSRVSAIDAPSGTVEAAGAPLSIAVRLEDQLDVARGAMIARAGEAPRSGPRDRRDASAGSARRTASRAAATCSSTPRRPCAPCSTRSTTRSRSSSSRSAPTRTACRATRSGG